MLGIDIAIVAGGFLLGSVPVSFLIGRAKGLDLRETGSRNVGATNLLRTCGRLPGVLGLAGDVAKGSVPALAALLLQRGESLVALAALSAVFGHIFTPWLGFRGARGSARMGASPRAAWSLEAESVRAIPPSCGCRSQPTASTKHRGADSRIPLER